MTEEKLLDTVCLGVLFSVFKHPSRTFWSEEKRQKRMSLGLSNRLAARVTALGMTLLLATLTNACKPKSEPAAGQEQPVVERPADKPPPTPPSNSKADEAAPAVEGIGAGSAVETNLVEGQIIQLSGTDAAIAVTRVIDFTSQGCLGGPVGCPDRVELGVTQGGSTMEVVLYVAHTPAQGARGIDKTSIAGHSVALVALRGKHITLRIEKAVRVD